MKQRHFCMRLTACILTAALLHPPAVFSAETESGDFEIRGGVLIRYHGDDEIVHVPEGVTEIGELAFSPYRSCKPAEKTVVKDDTGRVQCVCVFSTRSAPQSMQSWSICTS